MNDGPIKALLIEDNPADVRLIKELLNEEAMGLIAVDHADYLERGIELSGQSDYEIILLDLTLPDSQGLETVSKVHEAVPEMTIVVFTHFDDESVGHEAVKRGAQDYLIKGEVDGKLLFRSIKYAIERKRNQLRLQESEKRFRKLIENFSDGILVVDKAGTIKFLNPAAESILGRKASQLVGEELGFAIVADKATEIDINRPDGKIVVAEMKIAETIWQDEKASLISLRDITRRRQAEEELIRSRKFESVAYFSGGLAHDFNNLIQSISGFVEIELDDAEPGSFLWQNLSRAFEATTEAKNLLRNFIDIFHSKLSDKRVGRIDAAIKNAVQLFDTGEKVRFEVNIAEKLCQVDFDEPRFHQVLINVLQNAVESMPNGGVVCVSAALSGGDFPDDSPSVAASGESRKKYVKISIADQGSGISKRDLAKIFDPYFSTKERGKQKGMGLGLTNAYSIVHGHLGQIFVESEPSEGTTVHILLPCVDELVDEP